jgi:hypothetical protein
MPTIVTWNLQRRRVSNDTSVSDGESLRQTVLKDLVAAADVVLLQEAPQSLYAAAQQQQIGLLPEEMRGVVLNGNKLYANSHDDTQGDNACRNVIIVGRDNGANYQSIPDTFMSGGEGCRFPVSIYDAQSHILYTSLHATSGNSAGQNTRDYIRGFDYFNGNQNNWMWVIGADFNFEAAGNPTGEFGRIKQPGTATHSSGGVLDGFYYDWNNAVNQAAPAIANSQATLWQHPYYVTRMQAGFGYQVQDPAAVPGRRTPARWITLSDHAPVVIQW